jgi:hypothetical protein
MMHYREDFTPEELKQFKAELDAQDAAYQIMAKADRETESEWLANASPDDIEAAMEEAEYNDFLYSLPR